MTPDSLPNPPSNLIPFDDPITPREIGQHLRRMMDLNGVTCRELGLRLRLEARTIEAWTEGRNLTKVAVVLAAFEAMGCVVKILPPKRTRPALT